VTHRRLTIACAALCAALAACRIEAQPASRRRALLIGINDYSASTLGTHPRPPLPAGRDWPRLSGAVNDVEAMQEMLVLFYGFQRQDILVLTNQAATRQAIVQAIEQHLVRNTAKGDEVFFYFGGHGSQVRNSRSDEPDKLDETIVPADSRLGAPDIRDKELRRFFNGILDRGARLTVMLDNCHSGSGARGLATGARPRGVHPDDRDIADGRDYGPRPENRGALVLSASQDLDDAWETRDSEGKMHGAFSWAWLRAMRDSSPDESAAETFARASARMSAERPYQQPVLAGSAARSRPFLGARLDRRGDRTVIGVEKVRGDGTVLLQGGWAHGLAVGSELRLFSDAHSAVRLTITALKGLGQSEARMAAAERSLPQAIQSGALFEVVGWAAPPAPPLRVWMPRVSGNAQNLAVLGRTMAAAAAKRKLHWVLDPIEERATYHLRRGPAQWELLGPAGKAEGVGNDAAALAVIARLPFGASLFVQFPAPAAMIDRIALGTGIDRADRPEDADYILAGRYHQRRLAYAWVRPAVTKADRRRTGLPLRGDWTVEDDAAGTLRDGILALRKIQAWHLLDSPAEGRFVYRLNLRRTPDGELAQDSVTGDEQYGLLLRAASPLPARVPPRYVYVFSIDSYGKSSLLYPLGGSVENYFPLPSGPPPGKIALGASASIQVTPPYGVDTYFLLSTDERLTNEHILEWDGVRTRDGAPLTQLEELLLLTSSASRSATVITPSTWSIERLVVESVPRPKPAKRQP
jgi:uncharacterized caspase-like protein